MKKLIASAVAAAVLLVCIAAGALIKERSYDDYGSIAVELNEIQKLCENGDTASAAQAASVLRTNIADHKHSSIKTVMIMCFVCIAFLTAVCVYTVVVVVKPFRRLTDFAERVALGDLDVPLRYERTNLFGRFTWAFDSMRNEISKARTCEREAIDSNKTIIAALSHDIKTPVSSIRAYAEALDLGMGSSPEKQQTYIDTIIKKCDEVTRITNDMLTHSLTELDRLKMSPEVFELGSFVSQTVSELSAVDDIHYEKTLYDISVNADKGRIAQVIENIISNSRKYAGTEINISISCTEDTAVIHFRDYGAGIPEEDIPFVMNKFYRGRNSKDADGTGLGLYIVKYIAEQSGGKAEILNLNDGFEVNLSLPVYKQ